MTSIRFVGFIVAFVASSSCGVSLEEDPVQYCVNLWNDGGRKLNYGEVAETAAVWTPGSTVGCNVVLQVSDELRCWDYSISNSRWEPWSCEALYEEDPEDWTAVLVEGQDLVKSSAAE